MKETIKKSLIGWLVFSFTALTVFVVYAALSRTTQTPVWAWSGLTATAWNDMINNMWYLKQTAESKLDPSWNGSALTWLTKTQVWLWNVDNTSDLNKPISTAVQAALNLKADSSSNCTKISLYSKTVGTRGSMCTLTTVTTPATTSCTPVSQSCYAWMSYTTCTLLWYICQ